MNATVGQRAGKVHAGSILRAEPRRRLTPLATRVVVGVDGSAASAAALRWAVGEACRRRAVLRIVSAWEEPEPGQHRRAGADPAQIAAARVQAALDSVLQGAQPSTSRQLRHAPGQAR